MSAIGDMFLFFSLCVKAPFDFSLEFPPAFLKMLSNVANVVIGVHH